MTFCMCTDRGRGGPVKKTGPVLAIPKPINLPSRRAENNGFDPNIALVGGGSWSTSKPTGQSVPASVTPQVQQTQQSPSLDSAGAKAPWSSQQQASGAGSQAPKPSPNGAPDRGFPRLGETGLGELPDPFFRVYATLWGICL